MDRDKRWERVKEAYDSLVKGANLCSLMPSEYLQKSYDDGVTDEFVKPASFNGFSGMGEDDGVIFINFRNDRAREICEALGEEKFSEFERPFAIKNLIT